MRPCQDLATRLFPSLWRTGNKAEAWGSRAGSRFLSACVSAQRLMVGCPVPGSRRAKGGCRLGVSPHLRSSGCGGLREEMAFFSFSMTTKGMLEKGTSGNKMQRQRRPRSAELMG